uniref:Hexosyltransferase n=1 Tax=Steinernema glaseri TaxID=37863 RepID=A0A1I7ZBT8_9BILA
MHEESDVKTSEGCLVSFLEPAGQVLPWTKEQKDWPLPYVLSKEDSCFKRLCASFEYCYYEHSPKTGTFTTYHKPDGTKA